MLRRFGKNSNKIQSGNVVVDLDASRVYINQNEVIFTALGNIKFYHYYLWIKENNIKRKNIRKNMGFSR